MTTDRTGPLSGLKIIEFAGIGPGPFAGMMLADMGATVIRVDRPGPAPNKPEADFLARGRQSIVLDLKKPEAIEVALSLLADADGLIEGLRRCSRPRAPGRGTWWMPQSATARPVL